MRAADIALSVVCFVCFTVGTPLNIVSFRYFWRQTWNVTNIIYLAVTAVDSLTSVLILPVGESTSNLNWT